MALPRGRGGTEKEKNKKGVKREGGRTQTTKKGLSKKNGRKLGQRKKGTTCYEELCKKAEVPNQCGVDHNSQSVPHTGKDDNEGKQPGKEKKRGKKAPRKGGGGQGVVNGHAQWREKNQT